MTPPSNWPSKSQRKFWGWVCSPASRHPDSLYWFMKKIYGMDAFMRDNPSKQWFVRRVHRPYCAWKQNHYYDFFNAYQQGRPMRKKLDSVIPRGFLKSTIQAGVYLWAQLENPDFAVRIGSADDDLARDLLTPVIQILKGEDAYAKWNQYYGDWYDPQRTWKPSKGVLVHRFRKNMTKREASFMIFSVTTGFMGHHPEIAGLDDPVDREKLSKEGAAWLEKANTSVIATRPAMPECSIYELVGTRYHDDDPHGHYQRLEGVRSWTGHALDDPEVEVSAAGAWDVYFLSARILETGEALAPEINTKEDLDKYEQDNSVEFWAQMMNMPAKGNQMGLDISQIRELYVPLDKVPPGDYIIVVDTAFKDPKLTQKNAEDESVFEIWKRPFYSIHAEYYYVYGYGSKTDRIEDFTTSVVLKLQEYQTLGKRVSLIVDERAPGKIGAWFHYLTNRCNAVGVLCPPTMELPRGGGKKAKKTRRIRIAAGFWADGRVRIVQGAPNAHRLTQQMTRFEVAKHDDWADAAADIFHPDVYRVMNPQGKAGQTQNLGQRQIGPDDEEGFPDENRRSSEGDANFYDTIYYQGDQWE